MNQTPANTELAYFSGKLVFLVYDSRSGSTLFSRELARSFPTIIAGPEFRLNALFELDEQWLKTSGSRTIARKLFARRALDNLELDENEFANCLTRMDQVLTTESVLRCLLGLYADQQHRAEAEAFVIKKGTHLPIWPLIASHLQDVHFLHIFRDPRGAISSKLKTSRPYYPRESMAWGGAFLAAWRWREYSRQIRSAESIVPVLNISYESLLEQPEKELRKVSSFLSIPLDQHERREYRIPASERYIHERVLSDKFDGTRTAAWRIELALQHQEIIEAVGAEEMRMRGYVPDFKFSTIKKGFVLLTGALDTTVRILIHFPYKWWTDLKPRT